MILQAFENAAWIFWGIAAMVGGPILTLKAWDWIRARRYNRRRRELLAVNEAFARGYQFAMGEYARHQAYRIVRVTEDRPRDAYLEKAWREIDEMTSGAE